MLSCCRLPNNMECPLLKHLPRHEWVLMMHFTRLYVKFARIKSEGRKTENIKQWDHIADFDVSCCKNHTSTTTHTHTQLLLHDTTSPGQQTSTATTDLMKIKIKKKNIHHPPKSTNLKLKLNKTKSTLN